MMGGPPGVTPSAAGSGISGVSGGALGPLRPRARARTGRGIPPGVPRNGKRRATKGAPQRAWGQ
jgi:hypothetical protein